MGNTESRTITRTGGTSTITDADTTERKALLTKAIETLAKIIIEDDKKRLADNEKRLANDFNQLIDTATKNKHKPRTRHVATKDPGIVRRRRNSI